MVFDRFVVWLYFFSLTLYCLYELFCVAIISETSRCEWLRPAPFGCSRRATSTKMLTTSLFDQGTGLGVAISQIMNYSNSKKYYAKRLNVPLATIKWKMWFRNKVVELLLWFIQWGGSMASQRIADCWLQILYLGAVFEPCEGRTINQAERRLEQTVEMNPGCTKPNRTVLKSQKRGICKTIRNSLHPLLSTSLTPFCVVDQSCSWFWFTGF